MLSIIVIAVAVVIFIHADTVSKNKTRQDEVNKEIAAIRAALKAEADKWGDKQ